MTSSTHCPRCDFAIEFNLHVVRDCPFARVVWVSILSSSRQGLFFSLSLLDWILWNLHNTMQWR